MRCKSSWVAMAAGLAVTCACLPSLLTKTEVAAQPPAAEREGRGRGERGGPGIEQLIERLKQAAQQAGMLDVVEKLESKDPEVQREGVREAFTRLRQRGGPGNRFGGAPNFVRPTITPVMIATDKYLFILRGNNLLQLNVDTVEVLKSVDLPPPGGPQPAMEEGPLGGPLPQLFQEEGGKKRPK